MKNRYPFRSITTVLQSALLILCASAAFAAPPPAGTPIGNQASASYSDSSGTTRTVTSNSVQTIVQQVGSVVEGVSQNKSAAPGSTIYYPHTVTNTGNGIDTFALTTPSNAGAFTLGSVQIYADNGSGQPTGAPITSTGPVPANGVFRYVVTGTVPSTAIAGQTSTLAVTATSGFDGSKTATNNDVTTISTNAVVNVSESVSATSGAAGSGPYTYTVTYTNTGNATATALKLTDVLPSGFTYAAGTGRWSITGATTLTDGTGDLQGTAPATVDYSVTGSTITAIFGQVLPGQSATLTFQANVISSATPGVVSNSTTVQYNDGSGAIVNGSSNVVPFTITASAGVTVTAPAATATAAPGSSIAFADTIRNTGNGTDTFNVTAINAVSAGFPAGTTFVFFKADGVTPLTDTNGDGIPDTGPLAPNATYAVVVRAQLPANASGGPFNVNVTATSVADPSRNASATDTLSAVSSATVDVSNNSVGGPGTGPGPEVGPVVTNTLAPGASSTFALVINNTSAAADAYDLASSTVSSFSSTALPSGWTVTYKTDLSSSCTSTGATITNTGAIAAGTAMRVCAVVTVPSTGSGALAGNTELFFRAQSSASGASDTVHDRVTVGAVRSLAFSPNNVGQAAPGGAMVYTHLLTNTGNAIEGNGTLSTINIASTDSVAGFTSTQYYDANGNGVLDASDPQIPAAGLQAIPALAAGLAPGQSITIFNKVFTPPGASPGAVDATTVTVTTTNGTNPGSAPAAVSVTETSTVVLGNLTLVKEQALDAACNGTAGTWTQAAITTGAAPNACLRYRVTVTNVGSAQALNVVISDATPAYTLYDTGGGTAAAATTVGTVVAPSAGTAGTVVATVGTLPAGASAVLTFGVRIQP